MDLIVGLIKLQNFTFDVKGRRQFVGGECVSPFVSKLVIGWLALTTGDVPNALQSYT